MYSHEFRDLVTGIAMEHGYARGARVEGAYYKLTRIGVFMHTEKRKRVVLIASQNGRYSMPMRVRHSGSVHPIKPSHWCFRFR